MTLVALVVFIVSFAFSLGPVVWTVINEIFPGRVRGRAVAVATAVNWGAAFVVSEFFLTLVEAIGEAGTFWLFAFFCAAGGAWVWKRVPETNGRSLEQIEALWRPDAAAARRRGPEAGRKDSGRRARGSPDTPRVTPEPRRSGPARAPRGCGRARSAGPRRGSRRALAPGVLARQRVRRARRDGNRQLASIRARERRARCEASPRGPRRRRRTPSPTRTAPDQRSSSSAGRRSSLRGWSWMAMMPTIAMAATGARTAPLPAASAIPRGPLSAAGAATTATAPAAPATVAGRVLRRLCRRRLRPRLQREFLLPDLAHELGLELPPELEVAVLAAYDLERRLPFRLPDVFEERRFEVPRHLRHARRDLHPRHDLAPLRERAGRARRIGAHGEPLRPADQDRIRRVGRRRAAARGEQRAQHPEEMSRTHRASIRVSLTPAARRAAPHAGRARLRRLRRFIRRVPTRRRVDRRQRGAGSKARGRVEGASAATHCTCAFGGGGRGKMNDSRTNPPENSMPLVSMRQLLDHAADHGYGLPAFNVNNLEQVQAIMQAAAETDSPVIMQASAGARKYAGEIFLRHLIEAAVETYPHIPVVMHQDHGQSPAVCESAMKLGLLVGDDGRVAARGRQVRRRLRLQRRRDAHGRRPRACDRRHRRGRARDAWARSRR